MHTSGGHYCIPISSKPAAIMQSSHASSIKEFLTIDPFDKKTIKEKHEIATKLHSQFGHPVDSIRLKQLLKDANITDKELDAQIDSVTENCDSCDRYRKVRSRPLAFLPLAQDFNDCLALDLKFLNIRNRQYTVLHMIDVFSHFIQATLIPSKHKDIIVHAILKNWVTIFGVLQSIFPTMVVSLTITFFKMWLSFLGRVSLQLQPIPHFPMASQNDTMQCLKIWF